MIRGNPRRSQVCRVAADGPRGARNVSEMCALRVVRAGVGAQDEAMPRRWHDRATAVGGEVMTGTPRPSRVTLELMPHRTGFMAEVYRERLAVQADRSGDRGQHPVGPIVVMVVAARLQLAAAHRPTA